MIKPEMLQWIDLSHNYLEFLDFVWINWLEFQRIPAIEESVPALQLHLGLQRHDEEDW